MKRAILFAVLVTVLPLALAAQEVVIDEFPIGVGAEAGTEFFQPYLDRLQTVADSLNAYPEARAYVIGSADGARYRSNNDALNPALALGRAHALVNLMIDKLGVDSSQLIIRTEDVTGKGGQYRSVSIRVDRTLVDLNSRLKAVEARKPIEKRIEVAPAPAIISENLGLYLGGGLSSSPFGGIPVLLAGLSWKRMITVEGMLGHTFWNSSYQYLNLDLDTKRRMTSLLVTYYPFEGKPVGLVGGWVRIEDVSQRYYEYVRLSEGPLLGLRVEPLDFVSITAGYNPSKHRAADFALSESKNGQFLFSLTAHLGFGGAR